MNGFRSTNLLAVIAFALATLAAKPSPTARVSSVQKLKDAKAAFRAGRTSVVDLWRDLEKVLVRPGVSASVKAVTLQSQAALLADDKFPILSSLYAAAALSASPKPLANQMRASWKLLKRNSMEHSIQSILELLAGRMKLNSPPPAFGRDWYYYQGAALLKQGRAKSAIAVLERLKPVDRYYLSALYQQNIASHQLGSRKGARQHLQKMFLRKNFDQSPLDSASKSEILNYGRLSLARLSYEDKRFLESARLYRSIDKESSLFYRALFEQAWAFFMAGYPQHALGALHSTKSPFFAHQFNPEVFILESFTFYWMCRYEDSRNALADFVEMHADEVQRTNKILRSHRLSNVEAFYLFENLVGGLSQNALQLPKHLLQTAANAERMKPLREQLAAVVTEQQRLRMKGVFGSPIVAKRPSMRLTKWVKALQMDIGRTMRDELKVIGRKFQQWHEQGKFLYVELLMSEKDHLLGKDLHGAKKLATVELPARHWAVESPQSWAPDRKQEFWFDELGSYILDVKSMCHGAIKP